MKVLLTALAAGLLTLMPCVAQAQVPTTTQDGETIPDLQNLTFGSLEPFSDKGGFVFRDQQLIRQLGYNPSKYWDAGARISDVMTLGDVRATFSKKDFTLQDLSQYTGRSVEEIALDEVGPVAGASLNDLAQAIPELSQTKVGDIPFLKGVATNSGGANPVQKLIGERDLAALRKLVAKYPELTQLPLRQIIQGDWDGVLDKGVQLGLKRLSEQVPVLGDLKIEDITTAKGLKNTAAQIAGNYLEQELGNLLQDNPVLADVPLGTITDLKNFKVSSIPGLATTELSKIAGADQSAISRVPGLENTPLGDVLDLSHLASYTLVKFDLPLGEDEGVAPNAISGSTAEDKLRSVPCQKGSSGAKSCAHFEVDPITPSPIIKQGDQWVQGNQQKVSGGKGPARVAFLGKEPTGVKYFKDLPFKVVAEKIDENEGVTFAAYFQACYQIFGYKTCTPHGFGPVPLYQAKEGDIAIAAATENPFPTVQNPAPPPSAGGPSGGDGPLPEAKPCPPGEKKCILHNPSPGAVFFTWHNVFGASRSRCPGGSCHMGIDLFSPGGSPNIHALADGVFESANYVGSCGTLITSKYPEFGLRMRNHHATKALVRPGESIVRGQAIGKEGAPPSTPTNCGSGRHNHFELMKGFSTYINPACYPYDPPMPQKGSRDGTSVWKYSNKC